MKHKHLGVHRCHGSPGTLRAWRSFRAAERAQLTLPAVPAMVPRSETYSASASSPPRSHCPNPGLFSAPPAPAPSVGQCGSPYPSSAGLAQAASL